MNKNICVLAAFLCVLISSLAFGQISVLDSKTHKEFAAQNQWTGGAKAYSTLVAKLARILFASGMQTTTISEAEINAGGLENSTCIFVTDTLAIQSQTLEKITDFVNRGGLLVVIGDFARNVDNAWQTVWPCANILGLQPISCDQWGSATSMSGTLFRKAKLTAQHPILKGIADPLDFGAATFMCWVCKPDTAKVLAQFPSYLSTANDTKKVIKSPAVAVSVNSFGKGHAVFIAAQPGGKQALALNSKDIQKLLINTLTLAPVKLAKPLQPKQKISIDIDQVGFEPEGEKFFTVRFEHVQNVKNLPQTFSVINTATNTPVYTAKLKKALALKWQDTYSSGNFSELKTPGKYKISAGKTTSPDFEIKKNVRKTKPIAVQLAFLRKMAAGLDYYTKDVPKGGFVDASGDYSVRMWSMPYVAYCLAGLYEKLPEGRLKNETFFLFDHAAKWLLAAYTKEGNIISGVGPGSDIFKPDRRPWQDNTKRTALTDKVSAEITTAYCAALAKAAIVYKNRQDKHTAAKCINIASVFMNKLKPDQSADTQTLGNALWAYTLLYKTTNDAAFYTQAIPIGREIISRQIKPGPNNPFPNGVAGMFTSNQNTTTLIQYKVFHSVGIYLGLIDLYKLCVQKHNDAVALQIKNSLLLWQNSFLLKMSSFSPYGQTAHGIEATQNGYEIRFFPPKTAWTERHGLNCDHAALTYIALRINEVFPDPRLKLFGTRQLAWINGHNPLGVCMIESLGTTNPPSMPHGWGTGVLDGAMPNGISGTQNDSPCWINGWQSMEYWLPQTVFYLLSCASF